MGDTSSSRTLLYASISDNCMQTLYLGSFLVYLFDNVADWFHTYAVGMGRNVTFPTHNWVFCIMLTSSFLGTIFTFLILHGCLELAFSRRRTNDGQSTHGGCRLICRRLFGWLGDFGCFRLSFLILILEDTPMTLINFWMISSCSVPHAKHQQWPQLLSSISTFIALLWRLCMIFFSYRNLMYHRSTSFGSDSVASSTTHNGSSATLEEVRGVLGLRGLRSNQYDECWPVRVSVWIAFSKEEDEHESLSSDIPKNGCAVCLQGCCCISLCVALYLVMCGTCFVPCCYHYTCRRNALYHRHKFARTCTRSTSACFHSSLLILSLLLVSALCVLSGMFLSSAYAYGMHYLPPGIRYACAYVHESDMAVYMSYEPEYAYSTSAGEPTGFCFELESSFTEFSSLHIERPVKNMTLFFTIENQAHVEPHFLIYNFAFSVGEKCYLKNVTLSNFKHQTLHPWPHWIGCPRAVPMQRNTVPTGCNATKIHLSE